MPIDKIHMGNLQPWIAHRRKAGISAGTINHGLQIVRRIVNLAASDWVDEKGLSRLSSGICVFVCGQANRSDTKFGMEESQKARGP